MHPKYYLHNALFVAGALLFFYFKEVAKRKLQAKRLTNINLQQLGSRKNGGSSLYNPYEEVKVLTLPKHKMNVHIV